MIEYWYREKMFFMLTLDAELGLVAIPNIADLDGPMQEPCMLGLAMVTREVCNDMHTLRSEDAPKEKVMQRLCGNSEHGTITINGVRRMYVCEVAA